jgi:hypothetical protein
MGSILRHQGEHAMAHEVFLSYASEDGDIVEAVCDALERRAVRCWLAPRDMAPGVHYAEEIIKAINRSRLLVLILSANATSSPHVPREVERAGAKGIPILAVRVDTAQLPPTMEYFLSQSQWLDVSDGRWERHLPRLVEAARGVSSKRWFASGTTLWHRSLIHCPPMPSQSPHQPG